MATSFFARDGSLHNCQSQTHVVQLTASKLTGSSGRAVCAICWIGFLSTPVSTSSLIKTETFPSIIYLSLTPFTALLIAHGWAERSSGRLAV